MFATALSKRVANWIRTTNTLSEIVNTPKPGAAVGKRIADAGCKRVGVLEYDALPAGLYDEIAGAAPAVELADMSGVFADARRGIDDAERGLIARADTLARTALDLIDADKAADAGEVAGLVEKHARLGGAEEAYIAVAPDLDADRRMIRVAGTLPLGGPFRGAGVGCLQGLLGAADQEFCPRRGRATRLCRRRCLACAGRVVDRGAASLWRRNSRAT